MDFGSVFFFLLVLLLLDFRFHFPWLCVTSSEYRIRYVDPVKLLLKSVKCQEEYVRSVCSNLKWCDMLCHNEDKTRYCQISFRICTKVNPVLIGIILISIWMEYNRCMHIWTANMTTHIFNYSPFFAEYSEPNRRKQTHHSHCFST